MIYWTYMELHHRESETIKPEKIASKVLMCEDVGEITKVTPNTDGWCYIGLDYVIADGKRFDCNTKYTIIDYCGWVYFRRQAETQISSRRKLDHPPKHGEKFDITADVEIDWAAYGVNYDYLTNDPRMLYLTDKAYKLFCDIGEERLKKEFDSFLHIPERDEAIEYLKKNNLYHEPTAV